MLNILKNDKATLGFEVIDSYTQKDMETVEFLFEQKIKQGHKKINMLIKLDKMKLSKATMKLMMGQGVYAFQNKKKFRHISLVGNTQVKNMLSKLDRIVFNNKSQDMIIKYFDIKHLSKSWIFLKNSKDKLLHAGINSFLRYGYYNTSIKKISKRAGLTKGGFYHHFKSKDKIFIACVTSLLKNWLETLEQTDKNESDIYAFIKDCFESNKGLDEQLLLFGKLDSKEVISNYYSIVSKALLQSKSVENITLKLKKVFLQIAFAKIEKAKAQKKIRVNLKSEEVALFLFSLIDSIPVISIKMKTKDAKKMRNDNFELFWKMIKL